MQLESSYDTAFIEEELNALQDYFEIFEDIITEKNINDRVVESCKAISKTHQSLVDCDMDTVIEMIYEYFLRPLKTIIPERFNLGAMLWTKIDPENLLSRLYVQMISHAETEAFIKRIISRPDSRVSMFGERGQKYWVVIIRMEKINVFPQKLLK
ncbi:MAG: hypothetical protein Q7S12_00295 [bacterium]|nr:hypothetical protein [bacterium]